MHTAARRSLRFASRSPARAVPKPTRSPRPRAVRSLHTTSPTAANLFPGWPGQTPDQNRGGNDGEPNGTPEAASGAPSGSQEAGDGKESSDAVAAEGGAAQGNGKEKSSANHGSAAKRQGRNRRPKEVPPIFIPGWFFRRNVRLKEDKEPLTEGVLEVSDAGEGEAGGESQTEHIYPEFKEDRTDFRPLERFLERLDASTRHAESRTVDAHYQYNLVTDLDKAKQAIDYLSQAQHEWAKALPGQNKAVIEDPAALKGLAQRFMTVSLTIEAMQSQQDQISKRIEILFPRKHRHNDSIERDATGENSGQSRNEQASTKGTASDSSKSQRQTPIYSVNRAVISELVVSASAALLPPNTEATEMFPGIKAHMKLLCPTDGATYFLDKIVEEVASQLGADIICLDAQDLAEIAGDYIQEGPEASSNSIWTLGYDATSSMSTDAQEESFEEPEESDEGDEVDEARDAAGQPKVSSVTAIPIMSISANNLQDAFSKLFNTRGQPGANGQSGRDSSRNGSSGFQFFQQQTPVQSWNDLKLAALLETLVHAAVAKRTTGIVSREPMDQTEAAKRLSQMSPQLDEGTGPKNEPHLYVDPQAMGAKTVVYVRDFNEIAATPQGGPILDKLLQVIQENRKQLNQQIILVGASASSDISPKLHGDTVPRLQSDGPESAFRTFVVTPNAAGPSRGQYYHDERRRTREINLRHLLTMIKRLRPMGPEDLDTLSELESDLTKATTDAAHLVDTLTNGSVKNLPDNQVLTMDEIHRIAFTAIGYKSITGEDKETANLRGQDITAAMKMIADSDQVKSKWVNDEKQLQSPPHPAAPSEKSGTTEFEKRMNKLKKDANKHEKRLLSGVVNPDSIRTTFADVHIQPETIETLRTLTTLSLQRPDAFKYGVLASDKISGLLLYGPPGTGKTLLAKAVAKESGATILEVSGSDLYDMWVGEGEKNVRAVFTLAKKLAPCVVFIDEADAIFATRDSRNRNTHREMINQFLREWDGMTETTAFIMVATNRPFDLDDAALRRLPRRVLVDLPGEKDREAILGIHLKDEQLDPAVSLGQLATDTPLYSGSDLKNVAVAAALAAVREENDEAKAHAGEEPYAYPDKRTLKQHHFDKATQEISASISEDMSTLGAIRKFDEKYGDRRGKKKKPAYGFTGGEAEEKVDAAKVRK